MLEVNLARANQRCVRRSRRMSGAQPRTARDAQPLDDSEHQRRVGALSDVGADLPAVRSQGRRDTSVPGRTSTDSGSPVSPPTG